MTRLKYTDWTTFGWHNLRFEVPEEWNLGKVTGDAHSGYLRLDDVEIVRMEVEWRPMKIGRAAAQRFSLSQVVDRYLGNLQRKAGKVGETLDIQRNVHVLEGGTLSDKAHEGFLWKADYRAVNLAWRCTTCNLLGLIRIFCRLDEDVGHVAGRIFRSLQDHPEEGQQTWGVYGFVFRVPEAFHLEEYALRSGHLRFVFKKGQTALHIERLGMADLLLKGWSIEEWFEDFFRKALREYTCSYEPDRIRGHEGVHVVGHPKSRWKLILRPTLNRIRRSLHLRGRLWSCAASNRVFVVQTFSRDRNLDVSEEISREVACHEEGQAHQSGGNAGIEARSERPGGVGAG